MAQLGNIVFLKVVDLSIINEFTVSVEWRQCMQNQFWITDYIVSRAAIYAAFLSLSTSRVWAAGTGRSFSCDVKEHYSQTQSLRAHFVQVSDRKDMMKT